MTEKKNEDGPSTFKGELGRYQIIDTSDGSKSLWSEAFDENCHSLSGATLETVHNYIEACQVKTKSSHNPMTILEVGFGAGVGAKTTFEYCRGGPFPLHFISLEIDPALVKWATSQLDYPEIIRNLEAMTADGVSYYQAHNENITLTVLIGDARQTVHSLNLFLANNEIDAVYQDAFSPKKNPHLWTVEWFKTLKGYCSKGVILSTYSASSKVRKSLLLAGWIPQVLPGFQGKKEGTQAILHGEVTSELALHLERSPVLPLRDSDLQDKSS